MNTHVHPNEDALFRAAHDQRTAAPLLHDFWAHDDAKKLAKGLRAALDDANVKQL